MAEGKINVGVIGYGMSAKVFHIPLILTTPSFNLGAILQRSPKAGNSAPDDHPKAKHYTSIDQILSDESLAVIVITTTPDSHFALASQILKSGKHVLCEKPFVPTSSEASQLSQIARENDRLICVYQNRRWDADFLTVKQLHSQGTLGRIVEFQTHFDRFKPERPTNWKAELVMDQGGGVIFDLGTHILDQAYTLFGMPRSVTGFFAIERDDAREDEEPDSFTAVLRYGSGGPLVIAKASVISLLVEQPRFFVKGTKATFEKNHLDCQEDQLKAGVMPGDEGYGVESPAKAGSLTTIENGKPVRKEYRNIEPGCYSRLYAEFSEAIAKNDASLVPVKVDEVADVLRIIEGIRESAKSGKTVEF